MSQASRPVKAYHHGDLPAAAIAAGLTVLDSGDISLRAVARTVGVTHRALYNHFRGKGGFEAALAAAGYDALCKAVSTATAPAGFVRRYAQFALDNPALYDLMMRQSYEAFETHPGLRASADALIAAAANCLAPDAQDVEAARRDVMQIWMLVHGGLGLHRSGVLKARSDGDFIDELLRIARIAPRAAEGPQDLWRPVHKDQTHER